MQKERRDAKEKLDRLEALATKVGPRVNTKHTEEQLQAMIRKNEKKIKYSSISISNLFFIPIQSSIQFNFFLSNFSNVITSTESLEDLLQQRDELEKDKDQNKAISGTLKDALKLV